MLMAYPTMIKHIVQPSQTYPKHVPNRKHVPLAFAVMFLLISDIDHLWHQLTAVILLR